MLPRQVLHVFHIYQFLNLVVKNSSELLSHIGQKLDSNKQTNMAIEDFQFVLNVPNCHAVSLFPDAVRQRACPLQCLPNCPQARPVATRQSAAAAAPARL